MGEPPVGRTSGSCAQEPSTGRFCSLRIVMAMGVEPAPSALVAFVLMAMALSAEAQTGPVERIIDGDRFGIDGETMRLWGA